MKQVYLKPKSETHVVRDPATREKLPAEGATMPLTGYWARRLRDGDVVKATPPKAPKAKPNNAAEEK